MVAIVVPIFIDLINFVGILDSPILKLKYLSKNCLIPKIGPSPLLLCEGTLKQYYLIISLSLIYCT